MSCCSVVAVVCLSFHCSSQSNRTSNPVSECRMGLVSNVDELPSWSLFYSWPRNANSLWVSAQTQTQSCETVTETSTLSWIHCKSFCSLRVDNILKFESMETAESFQSRGLAEVWEAWSSPQLSFTQQIYRGVSECRVWRRGVQARRTCKTPQLFKMMIPKTAFQLNRLFV